MLRELNIHNFAIIDKLGITFKPGFTVLTGETGAGKSIIIDALSLLLGAKASADLVKSGAKEAFVEAIFDPIAHPVLDELSSDLISEQRIICRRVIASTGKQKASINDMTVSLQTLASLTKSLISIHGQHEYQSLLKKDFHLAFLDRFAGTEVMVNDLANTLKSINDIKGKLEKIELNQSNRLERLDFLQFQLHEIDEAGLKKGEFEALEAELNLLLNAQKLKELAQNAYYSLYSSENSCLSQLSFVYNSISELARLDSNAQSIKALFDDAVPHLKDAALALRDIKEGYESNPQRLQSVSDRLERLKKIYKKYGPDYEAVMKTRQAIQSELERLTHSEDTEQALKEELAELTKLYDKQASELSALRKEHVPRLREQIIEELILVGFQKPDFDIKISPKVPSIDGIDDVEFFFSANPGEPLKPLQKVASGGELSRIMLALRCVDKGLDVDVMVFDEVDAGIGGQTARQVGERLLRVASKAQTLCVTHLPQIASLATNHLKVTKTIKNDLTTVTVLDLSFDERVKEIARMLSGDITEASLRHAEELLLSKAK